MAIDMRDRSDELLDEIVRLHPFQVRQGAENQADAIRLFSDIGFESNRIAEFVGTTSATVRSTLSKAKAK